MPITTIEIARTGAFADLEKSVRMALDGFAVVITVDALSARIKMNTADVFDAASALRKNGLI